MYSGRTSADRRWLRVSSSPARCCAAWSKWRERGWATSRRTPEPTA